MALGRCSGLRARPLPLGLLVVALAVLFRLPLAWQGAAAYVTPDGALSGIVALHVREGTERLVFVPHVPYSGSLKSHITAPLSRVMDTARAFALSSVLFYALFVAALFALARRRGRRSLDGMGGRPLRRVCARLRDPVQPQQRRQLRGSARAGHAGAGRGACAGTGARASGAAGARCGLLLGLAFWCHILAVIPAAAAGRVPARGGRASGPALGRRRAAVGFALGAAPSLLWNAANGWASFEYLLPGRNNGR